MKHISSIISLCLCLLSILYAKAQTPPHIIIITTDDLGYQDLSCQGHPVIQTPHLDALAASGVRYTSCYAPAPNCSPSRAGLLTGKTPIKTGIIDYIPESSSRNSNKLNSHVHLRQEDVTLATKLKELGYATMAAGKWHLTAHFNQDHQPQPDDHGFDHWLLTKSNAYESHKDSKSFVRNGEEIPVLEGYACQLVATEAIEWMDKKLKSNSNQPLFAYLPLHEPHQPIASPEELVNKYLPLADGDRDYAEYYANVENVDLAVGRLVAFLEEKHIRDQTIIIFTSDNGPAGTNEGSNSRGSALPLRGRKLQLNDGGIRVPGIISYPAQIKPNQVIDQPICAIDFLPTLYPLAGGNPENIDPEVDGSDIRPSFRGEKIVRKHPLVWFHPISGSPSQFMIRVDEWKITASINFPGTTSRITLRAIGTPHAEVIKNADLIIQGLFNLDEDISEKNNLLNKPEYQAKAEEMTAILKQEYQRVLEQMHVWELPERTVEYENKRIKEMETKAKQRAKERAERRARSKRK